MNDFGKLIYEWQNLFGAFLGAATPILFWVYLEFYNKRKKRSDDLRYLKEVLLTSIKTAEGAYIRAASFVDSDLEEFIAHVEECHDAKIYAVHVIALPSIYVYTLNEDIARISTGYAYLDSKLSDVMAASRNFAIDIDDFRNQLKGVIEDNKLGIFNHFYPPQKQCSEFIWEIEDFRDVFEKEFINLHFFVYVESLIVAYTAIEVWTIDNQRWKLKLWSQFRCFIERENFELLREKSFKHYVETKVDETMKEVKKKLHSKRKKNRKKIHKLDFI